MDFLTITLLIVICYTLYYYFKRKLSYFEEFGIPYLPGWPLLGNMGPTIFRQKHLIQLIEDIYNVHPTAKYVGAFDFTRPVILIRDPELIKNVTIKHFDNFPDHKAFFDGDLDPLFTSNLLGMTGEKWKEARNLLSPAFTSSKMKGMFELMIACGKNVVLYLSERSESENKMVATKDLFTKFTNDVIATCAFGISVDSLKNPNNEFYLLGKKATDPQGLTIKFFLARACPMLLKLFNISFIDKDVQKFFKNIVSTTVKVRDEKGINRPDMLQLMMDARGKDNKHLKLDITEMTAQAFIFFFGGFDTTSSQMCLLAHRLAINLDIQKKLQNEIDRVMKETNDKPTYEAINNMPYLDAAFNESMRMDTQAGILDRLCTKAFELPPALPGAKLFVVEPGMNIWISPASIHKDSTYYDNPNKFDPDRYYQKKVTINDVKNLGFGIGPRGCIGNRFAILEIKILFFYILWKFNLKPNSKTCNPLTFSTKTFNLIPEDGFWLTIEPRQKS